MARVRRILADFFHLAISRRGPEAPYFTGFFFSASASERLEGLVASESLRLWGRAATREAHVRGMRLLNENLTPVQRRQHERYGYFDVAGGETGRRYRIRNGFQMNVEQLDSKDRPMRLLCFMPEGDLVVGDIMLAQKLALELFESDALEAANKFSPHTFSIDPMLP